MVNIHIYFNFLAQQNTAFSLLSPKYGNQICHSDNSNGRNMINHVVVEYCLKPCNKFNARWNSSVCFAFRVWSESLLSSTPEASTYFRIELQSTVCHLSDSVGYNKFKLKQFLPSDHYHTITLWNMPVNSHRLLIQFVRFIVSLGPPNPFRNRLRTRKSRCVILLLLFGYQHRTNGSMFN